MFQIVSTHGPAVVPADHGNPFTRIRHRSLPVSKSAFADLRHVEINRAEPPERQPHVDA
jgi:hypothetical protein